jgi:hypothetical protein
MTFSKMAPRMSTPTGSTRRKPKSVPVNGAAHNRANKELQMNRLTVQTLAQMLADQQAATNAQMVNLGGIVADLAATVRAILPTVTVQPTVAPVAVPVAKEVPAVQKAAKKSPAARVQPTARERQLANLAKGRAVLAAKRAAAASAKAAPVQAKAAKAVVSTVTPVAARTARAKAVSANAAATNGYVSTSVKLANQGHGLRTATIDGVLVGVKSTATGTTYVCGKRSGTAADRGAAVAALNLILAQNGMPPVRA